MSGPKVLIVEDEKPLARALYAECSQRGFVPTMASNGKEALEIVFTLKPDIILLDLMMPVMDGTEFMAELRKDEWGATVPILILTNQSPDSGNLLKAVVEGAPEYYLVKSDWKIKDIASKMWEVLDPTSTY